MKPGAILSLAVLLACSHDVDQRNPLDPALTPPVALQLAVDDSNGVIQLSWSAAEGQFAAYWVLRRPSGLVAVDTLSVITDVATTAFVDSSVVQGTSYGYRVSTVNDAGLETPSAVIEARGLQLPAVRLTDATFDAPTGSATVEWTPYRGARFAAYVLTRSDETSSEIVAELADPTVLSFRDSLLHGDTLYEYRLAVRTTRGETVGGGDINGAIHILVDAWPLGLSSEDGGLPSVRLYASDGQLEMLFGREGTIRLRALSPEGDPVKTDVDPGVTHHDAVAAAVSGDGTRYLSVIGTKVARVLPSFSHAGVMRLTEDLGLHFQEPLTIADLPLASSGGGAAFSLDTSDFASRAYFDDVRLVWSDSLILYDTFMERSSSWIRNAGTVERGGRLQQEQGLLTWSGTVRDSIIIEDDFIFEARVLLLQRSAGLRVNWPTWGVPHRLMIGAVEDDVYGLHVRVGNSAEGRIEFPYPVVPEIPYRLRLQAVDSRLVATVGSPLLWQSERSLTPPARTSVAAVAGRLALSVDERAFILDPDGSFSELASFGSPVAEIRVWDALDGRAEAIGVALPESNHLLLSNGLNRRPERWTDQLRRQIGPRAGPGSTLFMPISFDVAPDGRIYVLDAGNGRVVVYDNEGSYITEWGERGSGPGQFDFGDGDDPFDLRGSIAVDDDGFIYVADPGNNRIQKFTP